MTIDWNFVPNSLVYLLALPILKLEITSMVFVPCLRQAILAFVHAWRKILATVLLLLLKAQQVAAVPENIKSVPGVKLKEEICDDFK